MDVLFFSIAWAVKLSAPSLVLWATGFILIQEHWNNNGTIEVMEEGQLLEVAANAETSLGTEQDRKFIRSYSDHEIERVDYSLEALEFLKSKPKLSRERRLDISFEIAQ